MREKNNKMNKANKAEIGCLWANKMIEKTKVRILRYLILKGCKGVDKGCRAEDFLIKNLFSG